jgi:hypothetical protein
VSFSSTDIRYYRTMQMWKANENIRFNFADFQLDEAVDSENEYYIKSRCRSKIRRADTFILLIGQDTQWKTTFVKWEVEVALETGCRMIGANLDNWRYKNPYTCPSFLEDVGALFVPFSSRIIAAALSPWQRPGFPPTNTSDWYFIDDAYTSRGYLLNGLIATLPPPPPPQFLFQRRGF